MDRESRPLRERPMECFVGFLCVVSGLPMAVMGLAPDAAIRVMPEPLVRTWGTVLTLGGALVLVGIFLRYSRDHFFLGLQIERSGYWPLISGTLVFSIIIGMRTGWGGLFPVLTYIVFAVVCWIRQRHIARLLRLVDRLAGDDG